MFEKISDDIQLKVLIDCVYAVTGKTVHPGTKLFKFIRPERTESCELTYRKGFWHIIDYGGDTYNYISAYAATYQLSNKDAYKEILDSYIDLVPGRQKSPLKFPDGNSFKKKIQNTKDFYIECSSDLNDFEREYFNEYAITENELMRFNMQAVRKYQPDITKPFVIQSKPGSPVFAIKITEHCYKIYQPKAPKKFKWRFVGHKPADFNNIFGLTSLPKKGKYLFITEGIKDAMALKAQGYHAIALDSAKTKIPAEIAQDLKERFKHIFVLFDIDKTGKDFAYKLAKNHSFKVLHLPEKLRRFIGKDIADYFRYFSKQDFDILIGEKSGYVFKVQKYLSELMADKSFVQLINSNECKLNFKACTGSGKTTLALKIAENWTKVTGKKTIIAFPLNAIAETKHHEDNRKIPFFVSANFKGSYLTGTMFEIQYSDVMYANYDALPKLCEIIGEGNYNLIIDEQHCLNRDYGFRKDKVTEVFDLAKSCEKVILFSADTILFGFEDFKFIEALTTAEKSARQIKSVKVADLHKTLPALIAEIRLPENKDKKHLVLVNSKNKLEETRMILEAKESLGGRRIHIIQSGIHLSADKYYQHLMKEKTFPDDLDIILCTSVIATGIDIYADEKVNLIYAQNHYGFDYILCNQFFSRIRNTEKAAYTVITAKSKFEPVKINGKKLYQQKLYQLKKLAEEMSLQDDGSFFESYCLETPFAETLQMFHKNETGEIKIKELALAYWVSSKLIENGSLEDLNKLNAYEIKSEISEHQKIEVKLAKEEIKELRIANEAKVFEQFQQKRAVLAEATKSVTQDKKLRTKIKSHYFPDERIYAKDVFGENEHLEKIAEQTFHRTFQLKELGVAEKDLSKIIFTEEGRLTTNFRFFTFINSLKIALSDYITKPLSVLDKHQLKQYKNTRKALFKAFEQKEYLSSDEIQKIISKYYSLGLTKNKSTNLAKSFFELGEKSFRDDYDQKVRKYFMKKDDRGEVILKNLEYICVSYQIDKKPIWSEFELNSREEERKCQKLEQSRNHYSIEDNQSNFVPEDCVLEEEACPF